MSQQCVFVNKFFMKHVCKINVASTYLSKNVSGTLFYKEICRNMFIGKCCSNMFIKYMRVETCL